MNSLNNDFLALAEKHGARDISNAVISDVKKILEILEAPHFHENGIYDYIYIPFSTCPPEGWEQSVRAIAISNVLSQIEGTLDLNKEEPTA
jgi:hypothetical protein